MSTPNWHWADNDAIANHFLVIAFLRESRFLRPRIKKEKPSPSVRLYAINLWRTRGRKDLAQAGATGKRVGQEAWLEIELSNHGWSQRTFVRGAQTNLQTVALWWRAPPLWHCTLRSSPREDRRRQARWRRTRAFSWWSPRCSSSKFRQGRPTGVIGKRETPHERDVFARFNMLSATWIRGSPLKRPFESSA